MKSWMLRTGAVASILLLATVSVCWYVQIYPRRVKHPELKLPAGLVAIEHARIYTDPEAAAIPDGAILIRDGRIEAVGANLVIPAEAQRIPCAGCTVTAGFWNAHVHLTEQRWASAEWTPAETLSQGLADMFLARGFTTVVDLGSNPADTLALRRRIESGELAGPYLYTAGAAIYPPNGIPYYLKNSLPQWLLFFMPQPSTPHQAARDALRNLNDGADLTKLFTGSWVQRGRVVPMPVEIARAAVDATHHQGKIVFAHPSDLAGTRVAVAAGVDVLAHAPDDTDGIDDAFLRGIVDHHMAIVPTLKMFATTVSRKPEYLNPIYDEVRRYHQMGGELLFGTDVGYMHDYSTADEFAALAACGISWREMLAMLTTNPARRLGAATEKGTLVPGKLADLTVLGADPAQNPQNLTHVDAVLRSGRLVWQKP